MPFDTKETLCWSCKRTGTSTCSWDESKGNIPVKGWTAKEERHRAYEGKYIKTFHVIECPMFILDENYVQRMNSICGVHQSRQCSDERKKRTEEIENLIHYGWTNEAIALRFGLSVFTIKNKRSRWRKKQEAKHSD